MKWLRSKLGLRTILLLDAVIHLALFWIFAEHSELIVLGMVGEVGVICGLLYDRWRKPVSTASSSTAASQPQPAESIKLTNSSD